MKECIHNLGDTIKMPIAHREGNYIAKTDTIKELEQEINEINKNCDCLNK